MSKQESIINVLLVYLLIFVSGSWIYQLSPNKFLIIGFTLSLLLWAVYSDRKIRDSFILYVIIFSGFLLTISLYTGGSLSIASIIATTMKLLLAYFVLKTTGHNFTKAYIKIVVFLAAFSLFGYMSDTFLLFDNIINKLYRVGEVGYEGIFYVFRFQEHIDRNNSIFFEPGAYQIFLNVALLMLLFTKTELNKTKQWTYIAILTLTLITTFSTTGYLIFATMFILFLLKSRELSASNKTLLAGILIAVIAIFSAQFYSVIFEKIDKFLSIQHITDDQDRRSLDMLVDLEIFKESLFGTGHEKYNELFTVTGNIDPEFAGSSNGITMALAIYGLPFSLFLFSSYYWAIRKLLGSGIMSFIPFGMLMMFFVGEAYFLFSPVCLAIIAGAFIYNPPPQKTVSAIT